MTRPFTCSKCRRTVVIDSGILDAGPTAREMLRGAIRTPSKVSTRTSRAYPASRDAMLDKALADADSRAPEMPGVGGHQPADSFVLVPQDHNQAPASASPRDSLSSKLELTEKLMDVLSRESGIDHPICNDCTELLVASMNKQMIELGKDRDAHITYLRRIKDELGRGGETDQAALDATLADLRKQEDVAMADLVAAEQEHAGILAEIAQLEKESAALDEEERDFWLARNRFVSELEALQAERDSVELRYEHDARLLERLQRTDVLHDTFAIGHDGNFGTINGLRLGRLSNVNVEWAEINAAWGLTLLLLQTMADRLQFEFDGYRLYPLGSHSTIERVERIGDGGNSSVKTTTLELYGSTEMNPIKYFRHKSFDSAMVAFLDCLRQLGEHVEKQVDPTLRLPYRIQKDMIADACIRTAFNGEEQWTRALKFCLTNAKWILAVLVKLRQT
ncbi:Vacuolar protein sorting-associated protein atg6 [Savitreella phatthalungensis]